MTYNAVNGVAILLFPELKANFFVVMVYWNHDEKSCVVHVDGSYKVKKNKILEFLGKNKFPLITKSSESNTAWSMAQLLKACYVFRLWLSFMIKEEPCEPFLTLFGIEDANKTVVAAFNNKLNSKYLAEEDPSPSNIEDAMLKEKCKIDLCVVRITGSSNMGISLSRWSELMKEEGESADADIASCYYHWFLRGIHVVTTTQDKSGQHDVGRGKVKISVIKMKKKTTTIGDHHFIIRELCEPTSMLPPYNT
ncbi:hypothetical protein HID58_016076 [Brassica napus]|uniref:Decapping nuclease n=1 Tax=Brassica napus TaxID=3708 RepID=A0ABQ8DLW4_BRANA|nr:hypothetical protein HID58_016076 [Brassica napus]